MLLVWACYNIKQYVVGQKRYKRVTVTIIYTTAIVAILCQLLIMSCIIADGLQFNVGKHYTTYICFFQVTCFVWAYSRATLGINQVERFYRVIIKLSYRPKDEQQRLITRMTVVILTSTLLLFAALVIASVIYGYTLYNFYETCKDVHNFCNEQEPGCSCHNFDVFFAWYNTSTATMFGFITFLLAVSYFQFRKTLNERLGTDNVKRVKGNI